MAGPQTTREALMAELLGDVARLLDRVEALHTSLPVAADQSAARMAAAGEQAAGSITAAGERVRVDLGRQNETVLQAIQKAAKEAREAALVVNGSAQRFAFLVLLTGLGAGLVGGALGGLLLSWYVLGV